MKWTSRNQAYGPGILLGVSLCAFGALAQEAGSPMSAIDWLSDSLAEPAVVPPPPPSPAVGVKTDVITVVPLDAVSADGVGLLPGSVTGLPADLWGTSDLADLLQLIADFPTEPLPAVQDQMRQVLLAELAPPRGSTPAAPMMQARVDALLARGAVEEAEALLARTASNAPELFRREFDVGLLTGREQAACARMRAVPGLSPSYPVRIFCLARTGDWPAAAVTLESARALGVLSPEEDDLMVRFLDGELAEMMPQAVAPAHPTPLTFRIMEAIGEPMPTASLPLAFSHSDLRPLAGWKARAEAAERLARAGALPPAVLLAIYRESSPAASGGIWDRIAAVQALDDALEAGDHATVAAILPKAWTQLAGVGLAVPFANLFGTRLQDAELSGSDAALTHRIGLLSSDYAEVARAMADGATTGATDVATAIALGQPPVTDDDGMPGEIAHAFASPPPALPIALSSRAQDGKLGEALLMALKTLAPGADAEPSDLAGALAFLRSIGLDDIARRAALQILLLEPGP